jgi:hypothetical protein
MVLTGDVNLRNVTDPDQPFALVAETLQASDIVFGNLEGCLYDSDDELPYKQGWRHAGSSGAWALVRGGFHGVGCALSLILPRKLADLDHDELGRL